MEITIHKSFLVLVAVLSSWTAVTGAAQTNSRRGAYTPGGCSFGAANQRAACLECVDFDRVLRTGESGVYLFRDSRCSRQRPMRTAEVRSAYVQALRRANNEFGDTAGEAVAADTSATDPDSDPRSWSKVESDGNCRRVPSSQRSECEACAEVMPARHYHQFAEAGRRCHDRSNQVVSTTSGSSSAGSASTASTASTGNRSAETGSSGGVDPEHDSRDWSSIRAEDICNRRVPAGQRAECYACASGEHQHYHQYQPAGQRCHTMRNELVRQ